MVTEGGVNLIGNDSNWKIETTSRINHYRGTNLGHSGLCEPIS